MNLRGFYENNGVDYDAFLKRMMGKEAFVEKYLRIFMNDSTYSELNEAMNLGDLQSVEFKAHTLKGIALNLNLEKLGNLCSNIVSNIRSGATEGIEEQFECVKAEYTNIMKELGN